MCSYPTLAFIDQALGAHGPGFSNDPDAAHLERRARQLSDEYWSETVWLTGLVPAAAMEAVRAALERDRLTRNRTVILLVSPTESAPVMMIAASLQCVATDASPGTP